MVIIMMINTKKTLAEILDQTTTNGTVLLKIFERQRDYDDILDAFWLSEDGKKNAKKDYGKYDVIEIRTCKNIIMIFI